MKTIAKYTSLVWAFFMGSCTRCAMDDMYHFPQREPTQAHYADVNQDNIKDIVVESRRGRQYIFLGTEDQTLRLAQEVYNEKRESLEQEAREIRERAKSGLESATSRPSQEKQK